MSALIFVSVPSFEGSFRCAIERKEFDALNQELQRLESSIGSDAKLTWGNMEENIELSISLTRSGALRGTYRFSPNSFSVGPVLSGAFEADQSFLRLWRHSAADLRSMLANKTMEPTR